MDNYSTFSKTTGGTIYGYDSDDDENPQWNKVLTNATIQDKQGHAVYVDSSPVKWRDTTADATVRMDSGVSGTLGGWEN